MIPFLYLFSRSFKILKILFRQREQKALLVTIGLVLTAGMFFFHQFEAMTLLDALYFSVMTLATVGYGDFTPQTALGKIFAIVYVLFGVGLITALFANVNQAMRIYHKEQQEGRDVNETDL